MISLPYLLNLPHLRPRPPLGEDQREECGDKDDDDGPHHHVGPGAVDLAQGGRCCLSESFA